MGSRWMIGYVHIVSNLLTSYSFLLSFTYIIHTGTQYNEGVDGHPATESGGKATKKMHDGDHIASASLHSCPEKTVENVYIQTPERIAYSAQNAWILNATVRENIVFFDGIEEDHHEIDQEKASKIIQENENIWKMEKDQKLTEISTEQLGNSTLARSEKEHTKPVPLASSSSVASFNVNEKTNNVSLKQSIIPYAASVGVATSRLSLGRYTKVLQVGWIYIEREVA